ncbi:FHA domain-containing protein [Georgenia wutianyii]|uniref:FHA domain-containing protein n=1 Tax=Georgenia wutianyii TaxID=2585135 RepID=A0ABX5VPE6_9MICO|nr:FHA domain-containing protein [Georgenia wutianyii]QDB78914.1 FHA domain-containing protein [Georgenia wutianyii]
MLLTPASARPWLGPDTRNRPWPGHGAMMIRRREALTALGAAYGSWARFALGALAWALGVVGAVLAADVAAGGTTRAAGTGLLVLATVLGGAVVATGSALARATAGWLTLATAVGADGGRVDAKPGPETARLHEEAVAADRAVGRGELWRLPLLPRTLAAVLLSGAGAVLVVQAVLGYAEASTPYAADDVRGAWLARVLTAVVCLLVAALTASGLRRVHRARMHNVAHDEPASAPAPTLTPALGSGAIVVGGTHPAPGSVAGPPAWASSAPSADASPAVPPPPPAPVASPAPPPADTVPPADVTVPGPPVQPPPAPGPRPTVPAATTTPRVRLSDGRELAPGTTLVGRAPAPKAGEHADALLAVADERVSKTHLTVHVEGGAVVVVDRASTNGTVVHAPDGTSRPLTAGEPAELTDGDVVVLGSTTLTVGEPADVEHTVLRSDPR